MDYVCRLSGWSMFLCVFLRARGLPFDHVGHGIAPLLFSPFSCIQNKIVILQCFIGSSRQFEHTFGQLGIPNANMRLRVLESLAGSFYDAYFLSLRAL